MTTQRDIEILESFNPDPASISVVREIVIPRARRTHTKLMEMVNHYPGAFDEVEIEGMLTDCARIHLAVRRSIERIRNAIAAAPTSGGEQT